MSTASAFVPGLALSSTEGALALISIRVEARHLESLLEALARLEFPINPQIYHDAEIVFLRPNADEEPVATTLVDFPAYLGRLEDVYRALEAESFDRDSVLVTSILDELRSPGLPDPAGPKPGWAVRSRHRPPAPRH
jgi:hypothetical protein